MMRGDARRAAPELGDEEAYQRSAAPRRSADQSSGAGDDRFIKMPDLSGNAMAATRTARRARDRDFQRQSFAPVREA